LTPLPPSGRSGTLSRTTPSELPLRSHSHRASSFLSSQMRRGSGRSLSSSAYMAIQYMVREATSILPPPPVITMETRFCTSALSLNRQTCIVYVVNLTNMADSLLNQKGA
jgi:hypothetical protein